MSPDRMFYGGGGVILVCRFSHLSQTLKLFLFMEYKTDKNTILQFFISTCIK